MLLSWVEIPKIMLVAITHLTSCMIAILKVF